MNGKELIKALERAGWVLDRVKGSHHILAKGGKTLSVPVHAGRDIPKGTVAKLLKEAGLK
jgi:predicted RNA binding protein YcfA (HicA-like mRNA interferase family)